MNEGEFSPQHLRPRSEAKAIAKLFRRAAHPSRLRLIRALVPGERSAVGLAHDLGEPLADLSRHGDSLARAGLISRTGTGQHSTYSLTAAGARLARAYDVAAFGDVAPEPCVEQFPLAVAAPEPGHSSPPILASLLLNHVANPVRLRILVALGEGEKDAESISAEFGDRRKHRLAGQLAVLRSGTVVYSRNSGQHAVHGLTEGGMSLLQSLRATCRRLAGRGSALGLFTESTSPLTGVAGPSSPDTLVELIRSFADPLRLRILNLLASADSVCICHLFEVLAARRSSVTYSLRLPMANRLILEEQEARWPRYRLARPALEFHRGLISGFGPRLAEAETFHSDIERLVSLSPCTARASGDEARPGGRQYRTA